MNLSSNHLAAYLPEAYLKKFASPSSKQGHLMALGKSSRSEHDLFELHAKEGENYSPEVFWEHAGGLAILPEHADAFYEQTYQILVNPEKNRIEPEERLLIISTAVNMLMLCTKAREESTDLITRLTGLATKKNSAQALSSQESNQQLPTTYSETFTHKGEGINEQKNKQILRYHTSFANILMRLRNEFDEIVVETIENEEAFFICSDHPILIDNRYMPRVAAYDPSNTLTIPIDQKHLLKLIPSPIRQNRTEIQRKVYKRKSATQKSLTENYAQQYTAIKYLLGSTAGLKWHLKKQPISKERTKEILYLKNNPIHKMMQLARVKGIIQDT